MRRIHYLSGIILTIFIGLHLFNHITAIWGADTHIKMMSILRHFYRNLFAEMVLLAAVFVQMFSGFTLFRRYRKYTTSKYEKLHLWSGLYMAVFLTIHLSAIFIGRIVLHLDTNFYFGVAGLNAFPYNLFFIPYYGLAIFSFFGHLAAIHHKKMNRFILGISPSRQSGLILVVGVALTVLIFYGLTNQFQGVTVPTEYEVLIGK
ncbi:hypothetical protein [Fulvivirga kasyanovii]|uniref:DUF4405 domain-containing protein n=1 Tax=Fulvivirga kasyanovii TaxID=396812 RepID=A0ABW9RJP9_9BACT|nr:hypothetical protein [Fulvivirga kasyanovii]MTI24238.1 hypothetical protein [Fulvivirga kasyanovii]